MTKRYIELFVRDGRVVLGNEYVGTESTVMRAHRITDNEPAILTINEDGSLELINLTSDEFFECKVFSDNGYTKLPNHT